MKKVMSVLGLVMGVALFVGCGGDDDSGATTSPANGGGGENRGVSGMWTGSQSRVDSTGQTTSGVTAVVISQSGSEVSGMYGNLAFGGTVNGNTISVTLVPSSQDIQLTGAVNGIMHVDGTGNGTITVDGNNMSGTITETDNWVAPDLNGGEPIRGTLTITYNFTATRTTMSTKSGVP
jgi:hypothetical protein